MFDAEEFSQHALQVFTRSIDIIQQQFVKKFSKFLSQAQVDAYFRAFCENMSEAVVGSVNILVQFSQQKILAGYEQLGGQQLEEKYNRLREDLGQEIQAPQLQQYMDQINRQKSLINEYLRLKIERSALLSQNQFIQQFTNQVVQTSDLVNECALDEAQVTIDSRKLKELQTQLLGIQQKLDIALNRE